MITPEPGELKDLVRQWHQQAQPWTPVGAGTRLHWGAALEQPRTLSTAKLNRLVHHSKGDFTVTVESGLPLIDLQAALADAKQWLAVDWPWGSGAGGTQSGTIGGLIARGMAGGFRQRYLGVRDQVIGLEVMRADGTQARAGGQVVKNVAGYDLMRLLCGSWGSLGLITAVTLRTYPRQAHRSGLLLEGDLSGLEQLRRTCLAAPLMPQRLDWLTPPLCGSEQDGLLLSLVSISQGALEAQLSDLQSEASAAGLRATRLEPDALQALEANVQGAAQLEQDLWLLHMGVQPAAACTLLEEPLLQRLPCALAAGCGQGWAWGPAAQAPVFAIAALRQRCQELGGGLTVLCQPTSLTGRLPAWSDSPARSVIQAIKRDFDPLQQLSRGRLPGVQA